VTVASALPAVAAVRRPVAAPVAAGAVLAAGCVALAVIDPSGGPTLCPFRAVTGLDCPGCGGTRAAHALLTGHLATAVDFNLVAVIALPFLAWTLFTWLTHAFGGSRLRTVTLSTRWTWIALAAVVAFWIVRNLPYAPVAWMGTGA
jgi:hypothetical protein